MLRKNCWHNANWVQFRRIYLFNLQGATHIPETGQGTSRQIRTLEYYFFIVSPSLSFCHQVVCCSLVSHLTTHATCRSRLIGFHVIILTSGEDCRLRNSSFSVFLHIRVILSLSPPLSLLRTNVLLRSPFSNVLLVRPSASTREQVFRLNESIDENCF